MIAKDLTAAPFLCARMATVYTECASSLLDSRSWWIKDYGILDNIESVPIRVVKRKRTNSAQYVSHEFCAFACLTFQIVDHLIVGRSAASPRHDVVFVRLERSEGGNGRSTRRTATVFVLRKVKSVRRHKK